MPRILRGWQAGSISVALRVEQYFPLYRRFNHFWSGIGFLWKTASNTAFDLYLDLLEGGVLFLLQGTWMLAPSWSLDYVLPSCLPFPCASLVTSSLQQDDKDFQQSTSTFCRAFFSLSLLHSGRCFKYSGKKIGGAVEKRQTKRNPHPVFCILDWLLVRSCKHAVSLCALV